MNINLKKLYLIPVIAFLLCFICLFLIGCDNTETVQADNDVIGEFFDVSGRQPREMIFDLVYDKRSKILYIHSRSGGLIPFYSENGKLCKYDDNQIVEISMEDE